MKSERYFEDAILFFTTDYHNHLENTNFFTPVESQKQCIMPLGENIGKTLSDIKHSKILFDPPPRVMEIKAKINKWNLIKLKSFCTTKETINKVKRQTSEWEKIIANETTDKELISKNIQAAQYQKNKQPNQKMGQRTKQTFLQRRHTDG